MWPLYLINLAANTQRFANCASQFSAQNIPFTRIDAVNGWMLSETEISRVYDAGANRWRARYPLVRSEIGCYLSHINAWRRIAEGSAEGGFIFEDDFRAAGNLGEVMALVSKDRRDWDMVKFFTLDSNPKCIARRALGPVHEIVAPYRVPSCTIGYGLTQAAAQRLIDRAFPFFRPVDEDHKFFWETGLRVALVLPAPVTIGDEQTVTGTIGAERLIAARSKGVAWLARIGRNLLYRVQYTMLLYYHRARRQG